MLDPYPDGTGQTVSIHQLQRSRKSFGTADASGRLRRQNDHLQVFTDSGVRTIVCRVLLFAYRKFCTYTYTFKEGTAWKQVILSLKNQR